MLLDYIQADNTNFKESVVRRVNATLGHKTGGPGALDGNLWPFGEKPISVSCLNVSSAFLLMLSLPRYSFSEVFPIAEGILT